eukprot:g9083.t1
MKQPSSDVQNTGTQFRVYQKWDGNEQFFCGGLLVAGPNWKSLFFTALLIVVPLTLYLVFVGRFLMDQAHFAIPLVTLVLGVLSLIFLFITGCMDPGILPRQGPDDEYLAGTKPKSRDIQVNGHSVTVRYNETCHFYQPPRAHHCSVNDNCIEKFDHHCPWVGTTIGLRNYRFFLSFIFTASLLCIYIIATGVLALKLAHDDLEKEDPNVVDAIEEVPAAIAISAYCVLCFLFVGGLSFFHIYLVSTNQTTYENFRYSHDRGQNPYDEGCFQNCWSVWCLPIPKPRIKYRSFIQEAPVPTSIPLGASSDQQRPFRETPPEVELGSYAQQYNIGGESSKGSSNVYNQDIDESMRRPVSGYNPVTELMEIQVVQGLELEPPHNVHHSQNEGPEVRMFPSYPEEINTGSAMRPTSVPHQEGMEPRPRPRPATELPLRSRPY